MAINLNTQYSTKNVPVSTNYPYGQGMNVSAQGAGDAVPWEAAVFNDWNGYFQALLAAAGIVPSGTPDNAVTSQYLAALNGLFLNQSNNLSDLPNRATARANLELTNNYVQGAQDLVNRTVVDIDAFGLSGEYYAISTTIGTRPINRFSNFAVLIVSQSDSSSRAVVSQTWIDLNQNVLDNGNKIFHRNGGDNSWGAWRQITLAGDFGLGGITGKISNLDISVSNIETKFNNYDGAAIGRPSESGGTITTIVRSGNAASTPSKTQISMDNSNSLFIRVLNNLGYSPWKQLQAVSDPKGKITSSSNLSLTTGTHTIPSDAIGMIIEVNTGEAGSTRTLTYSNNIPNRVWRSTRTGSSGHGYTFFNSFDVFFYQDSSGNPPATLTITSGLIILSWIRSI